MSEIHAKSVRDNNYLFRDNNYLFRDFLKESISLALLYQWNAELREILVCSNLYVFVRIHAAVCRYTLLH